MAKTRSQTGNTTIKKEEEDCKTTLVLNGVSKITKRKPSESNNRRLPTQPVKVEEDTDTKSLLQSSSKHLKRAKTPIITQEQVNRIIDAIVNENMSIRKAASRIKVSPATAYSYYKLYKNDPDKKIPLARIRFSHNKKSYTQQDIENLIRYVVDDQLSITEASAKANMCYDSSRKYYIRYLQDPNHNIPVPNSSRLVTDYQKNEFIGYIINDNMTIKEASIKAKMSHSSGGKYYRMYFGDQNPGIATPSHITRKKYHTQEQIKKLISYIVDDKMTIAAASKKANMCYKSARKHYLQYLKQYNIEIPVFKSVNRHTQEQVNEFIRYIVDDKITIMAATRKANMSYHRGQNHYHRYLKDNNLDQPTRQCAQDKIKKFIGYVIDDKMTLKEASEKANMSAETGRKYYRQYLKDHNLPVPVAKHITQDQINRLIGYIVDDKMCIFAASKKTKMSFTSGDRYYRQYLKYKKPGAPTRCPRVVPASKDE